MSFPQRLKPPYVEGPYGRAEARPLRKLVKHGGTPVPHLHDGLIVVKVGGCGNEPTLAAKCAAKVGHTILAGEEQ